MKPGKQDNRNSLAWGQTVAAAPEMRELMRQAEADLANGVTDEEVRRRTLERAAGDGLAGIRVLLPGLSRKVLRASAPLALHALADHFAKRWKGKKVKDGAAAITKALGWDAWLAEFILGWAKTGEPGGYLEGFAGGVHSVTIGREGERVPMVILVASSASDLDSLTEELWNQYQRIMPRESLQSVQDPVTQSRRFRHKHEGFKDREIAEMELEADGFDLRAVDDEEFDDEVERWRNRVKSGRTRWEKRVTKLTDSV